MGLDGFMGVWVLKNCNSARGVHSPELFWTTSG